MMDVPAIDYGTWFTTTQAARHLDMSESRLLQMSRDGTLSNVLMTRLGRLFDPEEVEFLRESREAAKDLDAR